MKQCLGLIAVILVLGFVAFVIKLDRDHVQCTSERVEQNFKYIVTLKQEVFSLEAEVDSLTNRVQILENRLR